jgi:Flp pilus assembly protein TadG
MMKPRLVYAAGLQRLADFTRDPGGNVAMIFGITLLPFTFLIGAAIDYSGASELRARLQRATDATGLQLCQLPNNLSSGDYLNAARDKLLPSYLGTQTFSIKSFDVTANPHRIKLVTSAVYKTAVVRIMGSSYNTIPVDAEAQCQNQQQTFEIALVLDNTGSMAASSGSISKMDALKQAATKFVNYVYSTPKLMQSKISVVPFAAAVKLDPVSYRNASWVDVGGNAPYHWNVVRDDVYMVKQYAPNGRFTAFGALKAINPAWDWAGCFESLPYPLNVNDGPSTSGNPSSLLVPMFEPDHSGDGGTDRHYNSAGAVVITDNDYIADTNQAYCGTTINPSDESIRTGQGCKYLAPTNAKSVNNLGAPVGPNHQCTGRALKRLTNDKTMILNEISMMMPEGSTNTHEGTIWGWRTLAPSGRGVFGDGESYDKPFNHKILILMTDGTNQWLPNPSNPSLLSRYSAYGFFKNPDGSNPNSRLPPANANPSTAAHTRKAIDDLTVETCKNAQATGVGKPNVVIYTIAFSVPVDPIDAQGIKMMKDCAGDPNRAFVANDAEGIIKVFQEIGYAIGGLKLTQ